MMIRSCLNFQYTITGVLQNKGGNIVLMEYSVGVHVCTAQFLDIFDALKSLTGKHNEVKEGASFNTPDSKKMYCISRPIDYRPCMSTCW